MRIPVSILPVWILPVAVLAALAHPAGAETRLLRFPDIHGDRVVFTYAGDLWSASTAGGTAVRLTSHPGQELFARFSPDGSQIAFTGQYDGDEQVYVMPSGGGVPKQLTFYPATGPLPTRWGHDNIVYDWSPDGEQILFRSLRDGNGVGEGRLHEVPRGGGLATALPMPRAGAGAWSPQGDQLVYSPLFRDFRAWKRYAGGWAQDLYVFDTVTRELTQITDDPRSDRDPMWIGSRIFFTSDRSGTNNLYSHDTESGDTRTWTDSDNWDVRWPGSDASGRIVFEQAGTLHLLDTGGDGAPVPIGITVPTDGLHSRPSRVSAARNIEHFDISPTGKRLVFAARGELFSAPVEKGVTRTLIATAGAHEKWPAWSPDGTQIAYISDASGEEEIHVVSQGGGEAPVQLTERGQAMRYNPLWSPDGDQIAFSDKEGRLFVLTVADKALVEVANEKHGQVNDYTWSPRGGHLAMSLNDPGGFSSIYIWSAGDGELRRVTGPYFNEFSPAWGAQGDYLFYISDRMFQPQIADFEWNYALDRESGIYAVALRPDVAHLFPPESDEEPAPKGEDGDDDGEEDEADEADEADADAPIEIVFAGLQDRVMRVPVDEDNYQGLAAVDGFLLYARTSASFYGRSPASPPELRVFDLKARKEGTLATGISGYAVSGDGKTVAVREGGSFSRYDIGTDSASSKKAVSTAGLEADRDPKAEWVQIFDEVWRRFRDFFYVQNLHGHDWDDLRARYRSLLPYVEHRSDLNYVISEMIAELQVSHAYIEGGDFEIPDRPGAGFPGARFSWDEDAGRYRIDRIFEGHNEEPRYRSPLREVGVNVSEGDYLLAIDGFELREDESPYRQLLHKADRPIEFTVNGEPSFERARKVVFQPVSSEDPLIYLNDIEANRRRVEEATGGRIGYLHIPDMGANGIREFIKWYYSQVRREGMIVDVRRNGGGNISQMLIERFRREILSLGYSRTSEAASTYPGVVPPPHLVCLLDENSGSDGDIFPAMFKKAGLGPLIGKRSWGGVIGITNRGMLMDGGVVNVPEFGFASAEGEWVIEGYGVDPDIEVENDPKSVIEGGDPQLERAIREVMAAVEADPRPLPPRPADPVRTR